MTAPEKMRTNSLPYKRRLITLRKGANYNVITMLSHRQPRAAASHTPPHHKATNVGKSTPALKKSQKTFAISKNIITFAALYPRRTIE